MYVRYDVISAKESDTFVLNLALVYEFLHILGVFNYSTAL